MLGLSENLTSESLTPPLSPDLELMDEEPAINHSPVLVGKMRTMNQGWNAEKKVANSYPAPVTCRLPVNAASYAADHSGENGYMWRAHKFWNVDMQYTSHNNAQSEKFRNVMEVERSLSTCENVDDCADMFYEGLMYFQDLEDCARKWIRSFNSSLSHYVEVAKKYRRLVSQMLHFVAEFIAHSSCSGDDASESVINILDLLIMMSNQSQIFLEDGLRALVKEDIESPGNKVVSGPVREWLHSYTDIQCTLLQILPVLMQNETVSRHMDSLQLHYENGCDIPEKTFHWKLIRRLLAQATKMASEKFIQLSQSCKTDKGQYLQDVLFSRSPFPCQCVQQLLALCLQVATMIERDRMMGEHALDSFENSVVNDTQEKSLDTTGPAFWRILSSFMNAIIQRAQNKAKNSKKDTQLVKGPSFPEFNDVLDSLSFCWWWTWHVAHLFSFDTSGNYQTRVEEMPSCLPLMSRFVRLTLTSCENSPKLLAGHLLCNQAISSFWRTGSRSSSSLPAGELAQFHLLWSHFSKKLNYTPKEMRPGIHKFTVREDKTMTPSSWVRKCQSLLKDKPPCLTNEGNITYENGFDVFLSIFGEILHHGCWSSIKDRFYSRLQSHEIKNLNEVGMSRLFHLFILISLSCDDESRRAVFPKLLEYINQAFVGQTDYRKQKTIVTGLFSCMHVSAQYSLDVFPVATKCGKLVSSICKFFARNERNPDQRIALWKVVRLYFQNLSDLCQITKSFSLGQSHLMPANGLQAALSKIRPNESVVLFESFATIFSSISSHMDHSSSKESISGATTLYMNISDQFYPWLKESAVTDESHAEQIVATVLEMLQTQIQIQNTSPAKPTSAAILNLIEYFGCCVDAKLVTRYLFLVGLLTNERIVAYLNQNNMTGEASRLPVIQGCLKCLIIHSVDGDRMHLMTHLRQLNDITEVFQAAGRNAIDPNFEDLLSALECRYNSSKSFIERKGRKDQAGLWFNPVQEVLQNFAKSSASAERDSIVTVYRSCGNIVKHCSKVLYSTGKSGLITQIYDTLVLPRWIYTAPDKSIHPNLLLALGQTLHQYLQCLLFLDYKRDSYIQRVMSDIINLYLTRFPAARNAELHPFRRVISDPALNSEQRSVVMKLLKDASQSGPNNHTKLSIVVEILDSWATGAKIDTETQEASQLLLLLEQARVALRSLPAMTTKINALIKLFRL